MGVNAAGLFVGLTNRATAARNDKARSRGLLVLDALARPDADAVAGDMTGIGGGSLVGHYNPFHLLVADGRSAHLTVLADGAALSSGAAETRSLEPGAHVVCNRDPADPESGKVAEIRTVLAGIDPGQPLPALVEALCKLLGSHPNRLNPLENPCVHTPEYGTRSSTVLALGGRRWHWWQAEGAPCETKYGNFTRLLDQLRESPPVRIP
jgi:uncharacterized protein with NRDE domain